MFLQKLRTKFALPIIVLSLVLEMLAPLVISNSVSAMDASTGTNSTAATVFGDLKSDDQAKAVQFYMALRVCMSQAHFQNSSGFSNDYQHPTVQMITSGEWFPSDQQHYTTLPAQYTKSDYGGTDGHNNGDCSNSKWILDAMSLFGFTGSNGPASFVCNVLKATKANQNSNVNVGSCADVSNTNDGTTWVYKIDYNSQDENISKWWQTSYSQIDDYTSFSQKYPQGEYRLLLDTFVGWCIDTTTGHTGNVGLDSFDESDDKTTYHNYAYKQDINANSTVWLYSNFTRSYYIDGAFNKTLTYGNHSQTTCGDIYSKIKKGGDAYNGYFAYIIDLDNQTKEAGSSPGSSGSGKDINPDGTTVASSCTVAQVGWIVCPVMNMMGGALDGLFNLLGGMLTVSPQFVSGAEGDWRTILGIANAGLVIIFLIIIFSQITGIGIGNYGIKKMLPRLIVAAILIQVSMWLTSLAVDLSNVLGNGVYGVLNDTANTTMCIPNKDGSGGVIDKTTGKCNGQTESLGESPKAGSDPNSQASGGGIIALVSLMIASTVLVGALMWGALGLLIPVLLAGLAAVAITLGILIARLVIIILLLVLAPVAILAMVLPNTESLFKTWRKWLVSMLLLFPMVALLFGGAKLAAGIWATAGTSSGVGSWLGGFFGAIIELAILFLPLFFVPKLLQGSLSAIPAIGNMASKLASGSNSRVSKGIQNVTKSGDFMRGRAAAEKARLENNQKGYDKRMAGKVSTDKNGNIRYDRNGNAKMSFSSRAAQFIGGQTRTATGKAAAKNVQKAAMASAVEQESKVVQDFVKNEQLQGRLMTGADQLKHYSQNSISSLNSDIQQRAHMQQLTKMNGGLVALNSIINDQSIPEPTRKAALDTVGQYKQALYDAQTGKSGPPPPSAPSGGGSP